MNLRIFQYVERVYLEKTARKNVIAVNQQMLKMKYVCDQMEDAQTYVRTDGKILIVLQVFPQLNK